MEQVLPGADPDNPDSDPIIESNDRKDAGDFAGARRMLMALLERTFAAWTPTRISATSCSTTNRRTRFGTTRSAFASASCRWATASRPCSDGAASTTDRSCDACRAMASVSGAWVDGTRPRAFSTACCGSIRPTTRESASFYRPCMRDSDGKPSIGDGPPFIGCPPVVLLEPRWRVLCGRPRRHLRANGRQNDFDLTGTQRHAWLEQAAILQTALVRHTGSIYLEFTIPRMGRRIDAVVIIGSVIFVLEFKVGEDTFHTQDLDQVIDYALDLHNFHEGSHDFRSTLLRCLSVRAPRGLAYAFPTLGPRIACLRSQGRTPSICRKPSSRS